MPLRDIIRTIEQRRLEELQRTAQRASERLVKKPGLQARWERRCAYRWRQADQQSRELALKRSRREAIRDFAEQQKLERTWIAIGEINARLCEACGDAQDLSPESHKNRTKATMEGTLVSPVISAFLKNIIRGDHGPRVLLCLSESSDFDISSDAAFISSAVLTDQWALHGEAQTTRHAVVTCWVDRAVAEKLMKLGGLALPLSWKVSRKAGRIGKAESDCRKWLADQMRLSETKPHSKTIFQQQAKTLFGIGSKIFRRAWAKAIKDTGKNKWGAAGRPPARKSCP